MKTVIILRGLPGSGKTTMATTIAAMADPHLAVEICCMDDYFINSITGKYEFDARDIPLAVEYCKDKFRKAIDDETDLIIVANTATREFEFKDYKAEAEKHGYTVHCVIVENRHGNKTVHNVPQAMLDKMRNRFKVQL